MADKKGQARSKFLGIFLILVLCVVFVMAVPQFTDILTPTGDNYDENIEIEYNITTPLLNELKWAWNNTNNTIHDSKLVLSYNFNNINILGENNTYIFDVSGNGNNGTTNNANVLPTANGRYDGGFSFPGVNGAGITIPSSESLNFIKENNYTYSFWIKMETTDTQSIILKGSSSGGRIISELEQMHFVDTKTPGWTRWRFNNPSSTYLNKWTHYTIQYIESEETIKCYINGVETTTFSENYNWSANTTDTTNTIRIAGNFDIDGTMDELRIWDKYLNEDEVEQNYYSNLKRYDSDTWNFYVNESNIQSNSTGIDYTYFVCASDNGYLTLDGTNDYIDVGNIANYNNSFSTWFKADDTTRDNYIFGFNNAALTPSIYLTTSGKILTFQSNDNYLYSSSSGLDDGNWHHLVVNFNYSSENVDIYIDGSLDELTAQNSTTPDPINYLYIGQGVGLYKPFNGSLDDTRIYSNSISSSFAAELNNSGRVANSSLSLSNIISWWKINDGSGSVLSDSGGLSNSATIVGSEWESEENCTSEKTITQFPGLVTITANFTSSIGNIPSNFYGVNTHGLYLTDYPANVGNYTFNQEMFLDANMDMVSIDLFENQWLNYSNGTFYTLGTIPAIIKSQVEWANENDIDVMLLGGTMPSWLQNKTADCVSNNATCGPSNYTQFAELQLAIINYVTNDGEWIDSVVGFAPYNEPHYALLADVSATTGQDKKMAIYYPIFNTSRAVVKANISSMKVGGPSGSFGFGTDDADYIRWDWWFSNFTNTDFTDIHIYRDDDLSSRFNFKLDGDLYGNCSLYSASCSKIYVTEFNTRTSTVNDSESTIQVAEFYLNILNQINNNISLTFYQFTGNDYILINQTEDSITYNYNLVKSLSTSHPIESTVYNSTSSQSAVKAVSSKNSNEHYITVINTDTEARNITVDTGGTLTKLYNMETGEEFTSVTGEFNVGVMDSYEILYLGYQGIDGGLVCQMNLDENSGTTAYDKSGLSNNGIITGAAWFTDGLFVTLTNIVDYTIDPTTGLFTLTNTDYLYSWIEIDWDYYSNAAASGCDEIFSGFETQFGIFAMAIIGFIGLVGTFVAIRFLLIYVRPVINSKENDLKLAD